jgi:peptidyl-prolyl cis-trans isomerase B (cyclophilin B)
MRRRLLLAVPIVALLSASCGGSQTGGATANQVATTQYLTFRSQPTACGAQAPPPAVAMQFSAPGDAGVTGPVDVVLHTSCGDVRLRLDPALAPETVNSFVFLAEQGYFDGTVAHRVVPGFVFQAGDPTASGSGGPGYTLPDELPPSDFTYSRGVVAMANTGQPHTGGSQFFIVLSDISLPPSYTVFATVVAGMDVLDTIAALPMGPNPGDPVDSRPLETVYLDRVEVAGD